MAGYLIKDTTKEEREQIVAESLGYMEANCDGCTSGLAEMYQAYIDGKKELRDHQHGISCRLCIRRGSARPQVLSHVIIVCGKDGFPA